MPLAELLRRFDVAPSRMIETTNADARGLVSRIVDDIYIHLHDAWSIGLPA
ncbi:hypothetical protein Pla52o_06230 [Novipirellula galeiformis]|uniref:Uncharacterized protein n=1 Tax=Novipirellula galeiformis TaxID=2528004 RepID=A0A5C6CQY7_9BACT|nr:hypothetical protein [Novipirellula galeiformis]TWU26768.1 hypothetical protein Pla52o_06230 [Novipirellula galeiformis]